MLGILIGPGVGQAVAACSCPSQADIDGDGFVNVLDMVGTADAAAQGGPTTQDPDCPVAREDFNADGYIDARDVVGIAGYLFEGQVPAQPPCDCETTPSLCDPVVDPTPGEPGNSVVVESRNAFLGETDVAIAIRLTNDVRIRSITVPLVVREIDAGAYITSARMSYADRYAELNGIDMVSQYANADGSSCADGSPGGFGHPAYTDDQSHPVGASPEGFLFFHSLIGGNGLIAGTDATGSLVLTVDVTSVYGSFEIDTTCIDPANHLLFIQGDGPANTPIVPAFTKGLVTIIDNTPPVAVCQDVTVQVDGSCVDVDASIDNGSYDPDGDPVTLSQEPPGPYPLGTTLVTLTVEDSFGDTDVCQATVTVEDNVPPEIVCPDDIFMNIPPIYSGWVVAYEVTATDNCPGDVTIESTHPSGGFFPNGVTEVMCTATDAAGNTAECSFFVTIDAVCYDRLSDVNCDGQTDALDLAMIIDILYAGAAPAPPCANGPQ
jgi:hypothetical protein